MSLTWCRFGSRIAERNVDRFRRPANSSSRLLTLSSRTATVHHHSPTEVLSVSAAVVVRHDRSRVSNSALRPPVARQIPALTLHPPSSSTAPMRPQPEPEIAVPDRRRAAWNWIGQAATTALRRCHRPERHPTATCRRHHHHHRTFSYRQQDLLVWRPVPCGTQLPLVTSSAAMASHIASQATLAQSRAMAVWQ